MRRAKDHGSLNIDLAYWFYLVITPDKKSYAVEINTADQVLQLVYIDWNAQPAKDYLGPLVSVPNLQAGQAFTISAVVNPPRFSIYLNGTHVIDVNDGRLRGEAVAGFGAFGSHGVVRIRGARIYALP
jgi:hypothetical protein